MMDITPSTMAEYSKVNMYLHHDGYPEWQGVQLANWMKVNSRQDGSALAAKLVHDMYYNSCYLYNNPDEILAKYSDDLEYTDFANGQTRFQQGSNEDVKYHANKLLTLLQKF